MAPGRGATSTSAGRPLLCDRSLTGALVVAPDQSRASERGADPMSRLDNHVRAVQNRLALLRLVEALVWAVLAFAAGFALMVVVDRAVRVSLPRPVWFFWGGVGVAVLA